MTFETTNWLRVSQGALTSKYIVEELNGDGLYIPVSDWYDTESGATASATSYYETITGNTASVAAQTLIDNQPRVLIGHYTSKDGSGGWVPFEAPE
jgi:hypothetical protein